MIQCCLTIFGGMAVVLDQNEYPYIEQVKHLPVYLTGIGGTEWQGHIIREEGYYWHQILLCSGGSGVLKYDNTSVRISDNCLFFRLITLTNTAPMRSSGIRAMLLLTAMPAAIY